MEKKVPPWSSNPVIAHALVTFLLVLCLGHLLGYLLISVIVTFSLLIYVFPQNTVDSVIVFMPSEQRAWLIALRALCQGSSPGGTGRGTVSLWGRAPIPS